MLTEMQGRGKKEGSGEKLRWQRDGRSALHYGMPKPDCQGTEDIATQLATRPRPEVIRPRRQMRRHASNGSEKGPAAIEAKRNSAPGDKDSETFNSLTLASACALEKDTLPNARIY